MPCFLIKVYTVAYTILAKYFSSLLIIFDVITWHKNKVLFTFIQLIRPDIRTCSKKVKPMLPAAGSCQMQPDLPISMQLDPGICSGRRAYVAGSASDSSGWEAIYFIDFNRTVLIIRRHHLEGCT